MSKQTKIYSATVLFIILLVAIIIVSDSQTGFTEQLIYSATEKIKTEITNYLNPITVDIQKAKNDREKNVIEYTSEIGLNNYFIPFLSNHPTIYSVKYFDNDGRQYLLYKEKKSFVSAFRIEKKFNNEVTWKRWDGNLKELSKWKEKVPRDPIRQNWKQYFTQDIIPDSIYWFDLKSFYNSSFGELNAITFSGTKKNKNLFGLAIGIKINDMLSLIPELNLYSNPKLFFINHKQHIIPIIIDVKESIRKEDRAFTRANIKDSVVISFWDNWQELGRDSVSTFMLEINNQQWWAQIDKINLNYSKLQLGVVISESDLIFAHLFDTYVIIFVMLIVLVIITIIYWVKKKKKNSTENGKLTVEGLKKLLEKGESEFFELKSSLRWDYREERVNKKLEEVIIKSISAFNNAKGGYLVIGVDDDNNILGLKKDYATLKKHNSDYFELHLRNLINAAFSVRFTAGKISINFLTIEGKEICIIKIEQGDYPLFLKTTDNNGNKIEKFFIRSGNSSQQIKSLSEINNYINARFNKK